MNLPAPTPFSAIPAGGVFSFNNVYYIKATATTGCELDNGNLNTGFNGTEQTMFFPNASLTLF